MKIVTLEFTNDDTWAIAWYLRKRYGKDKRTNLSRLCEMAIRTEVAAQAKEELDAVEP